MPHPALPLPADRRAKAFRRLVAVLKGDGDLRRVVRNWFVPGDRGFDDALPAGSTSVRLTPKLGRPEPLCLGGFGRATYLAPVSVLVETRVATNRWDDSANLWAAIESAATGRGKQPADVLAFRALLQADGIDDLDPIDPADAPDDDGVARGEILITCHLS